MTRQISRAGTTGVMFFLLRMAFWLSIVVVLIPGGSNNDPKAPSVSTFEAIGFAPVDLGSLREGGVQQQPGTPVYAQDLTVAQARERLGGP